MYKITFKEYEEEFENTHLYKITAIKQYIFTLSQFGVSELKILKYNKKKNEWLDYTQTLNRFLNN